MLDQLSCEATHWERGQFAELISSRAVKCCEIYSAMITLHFHLERQYNKNSIYISHHLTTRKGMKVTNWPHSQCVGSQLSWSSAHRYRGDHGFESRWSPDIFPAPFFQLLKLENLLQWSLITFIYNCSTIWISYNFWIRKGQQLSLIHIWRCRRS